MKTDRMSLPLNEADPQIAAAIDNEVRRQHEGLELIASENFVSEAVLEAMGSVFTNKYAEGYPGKRYYGGCEFADVVEESGAGAGQEALWRRARQRAASRRVPGQHGGIRGGAAARRYHPRTQSGPWRTSYPRPSSEFFRQDLPHRSLRRDQGNRNHRLRRPGKTGRERAAETDHRRRQRLSPHHRFCPHAADCRQSRRALSGRHGAFRRTGCGGRASLARAACAYRDHYYPQDAARTSRRDDPQQTGICCRHRQSRVSRNAGRTAGAHHRGQSRQFPGSDAA